MCGLSSMSTGCSQDSHLATIDCLCNPGVNTSADNCQSKHVSHRIKFTMSGNFISYIHCRYSGVYLS